MKTSVFKTQNCSVARALEVVGDWWTLLIIREAIYGIQRFGEFEKGLGIAKNVLSERLAKLVETGVLERVSVPGRGNPQNYILTEMGRELLPVLIALMQWGDRWIHGPARVPVRVLDKKNGKPVARVQVLSAEGEPLAITDLRLAPGPGSDDIIRKRCGAIKREKRKVE